jgi:hypothetical protein
VIVIDLFCFEFMIELPPITAYLLRESDIFLGEATI